MKLTLSLVRERKRQESGTTVFLTEDNQGRQRQSKQKAWFDVLTHCSQALIPPGSHGESESTLWEGITALPEFPLQMMAGMEPTVPGRVRKSASCVE